jgi:hypothetical protein
VVAVLTLVSEFVTSIFVSATTAPERSITVPDIVADSVCAKLRIELRRTRARQTDRIAKQKASNRNRFVIEQPL